MFMHICLHLDDVIIPWEPKKTSRFCGSKFYWILGYDTSL